MSPGLMVTTAVGCRQAVRGADRVRVRQRRNQAAEEQGQGGADEVGGEAAG